MFTPQDSLALALQIENLLIDTLASQGTDFEDLLKNEYRGFAPVEDNLETVASICASFASGALNQKDFRLLLQRTLLNGTKHVASVKRAAGALPLPAPLKQQVNRALTKAGLDGTKPWPRLGMALNEIGEVLYKHGLTHDIMSADHFRGADGRARFDIDFYVEGQDPTPITNSSLTVTYHQFEETGRWEIISYLS